MADRLTSKKRTTFQHQISTQAKAQKCKKCQSAIWELWVMGILTTLDTQRLDLVQEIKTRLTGGKVFQAVKDETTFIARPRHTYDITPGDHDHKVILRNHVCNLGKLIENGHPNYFPPRYTNELPERPPF